MFEATRFTTSCEVTRATIINYLGVLKETFVVHVIRPFSTHKPTEIVMAPKVYCFDTGFVCYAKGQRELRPEDLGLMWEQCVLNEIHGQLQTRLIHYWRDKRGHEIDFVINDKSYQSHVAIECKFTTSSLHSKIDTSFEAFRKYYPNGKNYVVASDIDTPYERRYGGLILSFVNPTQLIESLKS